MKKLRLTFVDGSGKVESVDVDPVDFSVDRRRHITADGKMTETVTTTITLPKKIQIVDVFTSSAKPTPQAVG